MGPLTIFVTIDLSEKKLKYEIQSELESLNMQDDATVSDTWAFDSSTEITLCSKQGGANPGACTISDFQIIYEYFSDSSTSGGGFGCPLAVNESK